VDPKQEWENILSDLEPEIADEGSLAFKLIYDNLRGVGFTERQACLIVAFGIFGDLRGYSEESD
jgi:hypothetical protein